MAETKRNVKKRTTKYEQILAMDDDKINVLILGTSGCGKSTLINSILEANEAPTGTGSAITKEIAIYQNDELPFRMIDTVGFEYGLFKQNRIKRDLSKFCKEGVKSSDLEKIIHMIWFCVDTTTKRFDQDVLGYIKSVTNDWKGVPVIIVLTKSYSKIEIDENYAMAYDAIEKYNTTHKKKPLNVKAIIPVVAKEYQIDDAVTVSPTGLDDLVNKTIDLESEAKTIGEAAIKVIDLKLKNAMANSVIGAASAGAAVVGAVPINVPDAAILVLLQTAMLTRVSKIYNIRDKETANTIVNTILKVGATTMAGKALINALKNIPGINVAASVLNAAVAGVITFAAGAVSNVLFRKVYNNEIDLKTVDWEKEINKMFKDYLPGIIAALNALSIEKGGKIDLKSIGEALTALAKTFIKEN